jgi:hypothetical protein
MGKGTSTAGDKQSAREARHIERLERITRRDSESQTNDSKDVPDGSLLDNAPDEKQSMKEARRADRQERITKRVPGELDGGDIVLNSTKVTLDSHHLDSEEEKEEETAITNYDNRNASMGRDRRPRLSDSEEEEETQGLAPTRPGAVAVGGLFTGRTSPSVLSESQGPSAIDDEQSTIMGELAEASEREEELERQLQELENVQNRAVTGTVIVENSGGDHVKNGASSPFGRKERRLLIGAAFALLLVVGVILGVTIPNDKDSPTTLTQSSAPTKAPTAAPTACARLDCLVEILLQNEVADAEALQDDSSPQFLALRWLANNDPAVLDLDSTSTVILVERYVLVVLYFATGGEGGLNVLSFLTASSVCEWKGVSCNGDDLVIALILGKPKHGEVIVLLSKICIDSPVYFPFRLSGMGDWD